MKKILFLILLITSLAHAQNPQTTYYVATIADMKLYFGKAERIHVTETNQDYVDCTSCTPDEILIFDGAGSRNWKTTLYTTSTKAYWFNHQTGQAGGGPVWQFSDRPYSPFQFHNTDTVSVNDVAVDANSPTEALPLSGIFARRTLYYNSGIFTTQKIYGHSLGVVWNWQDSMRFRTEGGDYNVGTIIESRLEPRGTGPQRTGIHGTSSNALPYYGVPTLLVNTFLRNTTGTNTIHTYGWMVGISSYLVAGALDTVERFSFYQTNNFLNASTRVKKLYGLDFQHNLNTANADSSFGIWDQYGYRHWLMGNTVIGPKYDSSVTGYNLKVNGAMYMRGLLQGFQGTDVASTAGVMTLPGSATAGNVYEITGTNTITAIANTNLKNGYEVTLLFTSTAVLTDGTANSGANIGMELEGNTNFTGSADDTVTLVLCEIGGTQRWRMKCKSVN